MKEVHRVLKELRIERNLQQKDVAKIMGVSERAYSHYETGDRLPNIQVLTRCAEYYKISLDVLTGRYE